MDGADVMTARGLPFEWYYRDGEGVEHTGVPEDFTHFAEIESLAADSPRPGRSA